MADKSPAEVAQLVLQVDDARTPDDPFKIPAPLRALVETRLVNYQARLDASLLQDGDKLGATTRMQTAYDHIDALLRDAFNFINGLPSYEITPADKRALFEQYGWNQGEIGRFDDARRLQMAKTAVSVSPKIELPARRLPAALLGLLSAQIAVVEANAGISGGGSKEVAIKAKNAALDELEIAGSRVRFFYCSASDERDLSKELSKIGFQPRRRPGEAASPAPTPVPTPQTPASP